VLFGSWQRSEVITAMAVWGALIIAGVYMFRAIRDIWHGDKEWIGLLDALSFWRKLPYGLLLCGLIVFGCFPRLLTDNIKASVAPVVRMIGAEELETASAPRGHVNQ
jgi:NADH:ubiquinone oxidoreductase subunit 4 (subunit M)